MVRWLGQLREEVNQARLQEALGEDSFEPDQKALQLLIALFTFTLASILIINPVFRMQDQKPRALTLQALQVPHFHSFKSIIHHLSFSENSSFSDSKTKNQVNRF